MTEAPRYQQEDVAGIIDSHLGMLEGILKRLSGADGVTSIDYMEQRVGVGGVITEHLTVLGLRAATHAHGLAVDASLHMWELEGHVVFSEDQRALDSLTYDVTRLLCVISAALGGVSTHPEPTHVTWGVHGLLTDMLKRARSEHVQAETKKVESLSPMGDRASDTHSAAAMAAPSTEEVAHA